MRALSFFILFYGLSIASGSAFGQDKTKLIQQIRKEFQIINSNKSLKKKILNNKDFLEQAPDGGGQLTAYYKGNELKKIKRWIGLSYANTIFELYYTNNKLIFVYEETNSFVYDEKKEKFRYDSTERSFEGRYYFVNNKLIDHITTGHNRFEDDTIDPEKTLLKESEEIKLMLIRKWK